MTRPAFDTHRAVKVLRGAGFNDAQAEAVVEQINSAFSENVATKHDVAKLSTKDELREAVARLATRDELYDALSKLSTKEELREATAKLATRDELHEALAKLATRDELEKLELRMSAQLEKQATVYLRYLMATAAGIVVLSQALDVLVG